MPTALPIELKLLAWSVILLVAHIVIQATLAIGARGLPWGLSPRDEAGPAADSLAGRAARALGNFLETYLAFVALALALVISNRGGGSAATGAWVWLLARIVYLPVYLLGIPVLRTLVFLASAIGLVMMLVPLL